MYIHIESILCPNILLTTPPVQKKMQAYVLIDPSILPQSKTTTVNWLILDTETKVEEEYIYIYISEGDSECTRQTQRQKPNQGCNEMHGSNTQDKTWVE